MFKTPLTIKSEIMQSAFNMFRVECKRFQKKSSTITRLVCLCSYVFMERGSGKTYVKNLETGDIQHTDEVLSLLLGVQGLVTLLHQPLEQPVEHGLRHGAYGVGYLVLVTTLGHELVTDLDPWFKQVLVKIGTVAAKQLGHAVTLLKCEMSFYHFSSRETTFLMS